MLIIKKDDIFYENLDFLTLRVSRKDNPLFITCIGLVNNSPELFLDHGFKLVFLDIKRNGKAKLIQIQDSRDNNLGEIRVKMIPDPMDFINHDELEFTSTFFTMYPDYLDYFLEIFHFDKKRQNTISRIDFCMDFLNYSVQDFRDSRKVIPKKEFPVMVGGVYTYFRYKNQRHKLVFYNKRLDTLDKTKYRLQDMYGNHPYEKYIDDSIGMQYITRVEYRKNSQSMRDLENNSFDWVSQNIRSMFIQYLDTFVDVIIRHDPIPYNQNKPIKRDLIYGKEVQRKKTMAMSRMNAYMDSYIELDSEGELFRHLSAKFGYRLFNYLKKMPPDSDFAEKTFFDNLKEN